MHKSVYVRGGDFALGQAIKLHPMAEDVNQTFTQWIQSAEDDPDYIGFVASSLCGYSSGFDSVTELTAMCLKMKNSESQTI